MKASVIVFPGSNCDRDAAVALGAAMGKAPMMVWHGDAELPQSDLIVLPGGFSYGDYLRSGAMAAHSPVMREVVRRRESRDARARHLQRLSGADRGRTPARGPDAERLAALHLQGRASQGRAQRHALHARLRARRDRAVSDRAQGRLLFCRRGDTFELEGEGRVAFRYCEATGEITPRSNPNGSVNNIAGIYNEALNVLGMMPHPERLADPVLSGTDGARMFSSMVETLH